MQRVFCQGDLSKQAFLGVSPTRTIDTGKGLSTIPDLTLDDINLSPAPRGFEENVGVPGVLRQGNQIRSAKDFEFAFLPKGIQDKEQRELRELRQIDDDEFAPQGVAPVGEQREGSRGNIVTPPAPFGAALHRQAV